MSLEQSCQVLGNELIPLMEMGKPQSAVCSVFRALQLFLQSVAALPLQRLN